MKSKRQIDREMILMDGRDGWLHQSRGGGQPPHAPGGLQVVDGACTKARPYNAVKQSEGRVLLTRVGAARAASALLTTGLVLPLCYSVNIGASRPVQFWCRVERRLGIVCIRLQASVRLSICSCLLPISGQFPRAIRRVSGFASRCRSEIEMQNGHSKSAGLEQTALLLGLPRSA